MACEGPANDVATAFMAALGTTNQYTATQTDLTLYDKNGTILALFLAEPANPLVGGDWKIDAYLDANGAVVTPVKDSDPTVTFMAAEQLSGTTGCNDFTGGVPDLRHDDPHRSHGTTQKACPEDLAAQETAIIAALGGAGTFSVRGDRLDLRDLEGESSSARRGSAARTPRHRRAQARRRARAPRQARARAPPQAQAHRRARRHSPAPARRHSRARLPQASPSPAESLAVSAGEPVAGRESLAVAERLLAPSLQPDRRATVRLSSPQARPT